MGTCNRWKHGLGVILCVFIAFNQLDSSYGQAQPQPGQVPQQQQQQMHQQPPPVQVQQQPQMQQQPPVHVQQQQQQQQQIHQQPPVPQMQQVPQHHPQVPPQQMHVQQQQQHHPQVPPQQMHVQQQQQQHHPQVPPQQMHVQQQHHPQVPPQQMHVQQQQQHHPQVPPQQMHVQHQQPPMQPPVQQMHVQHPPPVHRPGEERPWYENLPAVAMDYKVHVDAGKEDCYFQYVQPGAAFYVSFQVVRGGDGMAGFAVRHPSGQIVHPYQWQASSEYGDQQSTGGYYSVCVDNQFSRFAGKLINIYLTVIKYDEWDKFTKEIEALQLNMENFTTTIKQVEKNINDMQQFQVHSRNREGRDAALLEDNNSYVQKWSLAQILVITLTTTVQVYFVRKLFEVKTGPGGRTRI